MSATATIIGIDPGTNTGVAIWCPERKIFTHLETMKIHHAMSLVEGAIFGAKRGSTKIYIEDPNTFIPFAKSSPSVLAAKSQDARKLFKTRNGTLRLRNKAGGSSNVGLVNQIRHLPIPTAQAANGVWRGRKKAPNLAEALSTLPTPLASDCRPRGGLENPCVKRRLKIKKSLGLTMRIHSPSRGLRLQPAFVEWMMGYPIGWTG